MKKIIAAILITLMLLPMLSACSHKPAESGAEAAHTAEATVQPTAHGAEPTEAPTPVPTDTPAPTEDPLPAAALALAYEHGLSEEDIRGEYELFIRFSKTVEGNTALGKYREFMYLIFPVVADASAYMDLDHFFDALAGLSFVERVLETGIAGRYTAGPNIVEINTEIDPYDSYHVPEVVFHELMHFVDFNVSNEYPATYLLDGRRLNAFELDELSEEEQERAVACYDPDVVIEGGAEYFTAKYFAGAERAYFIPAQFLAGVEYIFGEEKLDELFFSPDSGAVLAELFLDAGYSKEKFANANQTLSFLTNSSDHGEPEVYIAPEDMLIDLYESKLGSGWQEDEGFLYILKAINGVCGEEYRHSEHAEFLKGIEFKKWEQYEAFTAKLYGELPIEPDLRYLPPTPLMRGGRLLLGAFAEWTDPETQEQVRGTLTLDYDFGSETLLGYEAIDFDALTNRYFG
ncbi:MAG: hypothetical protein IK082_05945 [Oscillospiraceae bacterium]|nr:hypothetical protein [Oscillospiraceae bacterium]